MAAAKAPKQGVITLGLKDKNSLYTAYMPHIKNGGIFVPTNRQFELGDAQRHPIAGRVVWITPKASAGRPVGIGVQFTGDNAGDVQKKIDTFLAGSHNSDRPTYTM